MEGLKNIFFYILKTFQRRSFFGSSIFKMGKPRSLLFLSFLGTAQKNWVARGIWSRIFGLEGKDTDHYNVTVAQLKLFLPGCTPSRSSWGPPRCRWWSTAWGATRRRPWRTDGPSSPRTWPSVGSTTAGGWKIRSPLGWCSGMKGRPVGRWTQVNVGWNLISKFSRAAVIALR